MLLGIKTNISHKQSSGLAVSTTGSSSTKTSLLEALIATGSTWVSTRKINSKGPSFKVLTIEGIYGCLSLFMGRKLNKSKTFGSTVWTLWQLYINNCTILTKGLSQTVFSGWEGKVAYEEFLLVIIATGGFFFFIFFFFVFVVIRLFFLSRLLSWSFLGWFILTFVVRVVIFVVGWFGLLLLRSGFLSVGLSCRLL